MKRLCPPTPSLTSSLTAAGVALGLVLTGLATPASAAPTPTPTTRKTAAPRADFTSYDDRVIFQSFSLFQPESADMYRTLGTRTAQLNKWGITDVWLPPAYRSFGMSRYQEGYAVADRYDLGEFDLDKDGRPDPTKYGTAGELKSLMTSLHGANLKGQVDLVPNQMMGLTGREAVTATRTDQNGNRYIADGRPTDFVNQIYLAYTKGGGPGQAKYGLIKEFNADHWNGTSLQQIGYGDTLKDANGKPYRVDQPNAADNNVPGWLDLSKGHNTVDGYLSSRDAYQIEGDNWRPYLINDPDFVKYAKSSCGFPDDAAVRTGSGSKSIWDCRDAFIDQSQDYAKNPDALPGTKYNYWGEEPTVDNSVTGIDWPDQIRFAGHDQINQGLPRSQEFLVGNDFDNARADVQAEQRNWMQFLLNNYDFDGFRVDAAAHYPTKILDMVAEETAKKFGNDTSQYLNYLETYDGGQRGYLDGSGNRQLAYDATLFFTMQDSVNRASQPLGNVWKFSDANKAGNRMSPGGDYRPNWSFVSNHDQEKNWINAQLLKDLGMREGGCSGGPLKCKSLNVSYNKAAEQQAISEWNADLAKPSSQKQISPKNVPAQYAIILTNKATTPTVFYGDLYRTDGAYMAEKTPYFDEIDALLKARKTYAKGEQKAYDFGTDTAASVRLGMGRESGLATVISTNPSVDKTIRIDMGGRDHANQAYRDVTDKNTQTLITDGQGFLTVPVKGSANTPEVSGYLGVWAPVDNTAVIATHGAIDAKWQQVKGIVGAPTSPENCYLVGGGCFQTFERASIYWSPSTGAQFVRGRIRDKWGQLGWEGGFYGYPTSDEFCGLRDGGCGQRFQNGLILWSPATDAHAVQGRILAAYADLGWENSKLGYPLQEEFCGLRDGGCVQRFQGGLIYWSRATDSRVVLGAIEQAYANQGWENGIGYPQVNEFCGLRDGGCGQHFQYGSIYWSPASGSWVVKGAIRDEYAARGWENGPLGYPVSNEQCDAGGCVQYYQRGRITWNLRDGARSWF
ncbi:glycoside hydrolase family 70 protein [Enemella evansiae]|uniref:glycoside hydrolase family 70 protein n=1 Tax=Enemella evansiae TaxID=2016499 RepID=UPI001553555C|nr:glycoside hydrolase family 70 protein [Enemella evansiae]